MNQASCRESEYIYIKCINDLTAFLYLYPTYRSIREYLKHDAVELLQNLRHALQEVPEEQRIQFQRLLAASVCRRSYSSRKRPAVTLRKAIPFITGEDGTLLPGVLEYLTEGIVPLLYTYYTSLFDSTSPVEQDEEEFELSVQIASALVVSKINVINTNLMLFCSSKELLDDIEDFMGSKAQIQQFHVTVLTLCTSQPIQEMLSIDTTV